MIFFLSYDLVEEVALEVKRKVVCLPSLSLSVTVTFLIGALSTGTCFQSFKRNVTD